jgi:hypothetical protein
MALADAMNLSLWIFAKKHSDTMQIRPKSVSLERQPSNPVNLYILLNLMRSRLAKSKRSCGLLFELGNLIGKHYAVDSDLLQSSMLEPAVQIPE